ncbi:MAG: DUF3489 domain-containing protein [Bauldia sp.]|nr:DUF3489 domain-containing protein [Bauldia sp.]
MTPSSRKQSAKSNGKTSKARASKTRKPAGTVPTSDQPSKLDQIAAMLFRPNGATLADLVTATGWQTHSVRGALAGALKKKGHVIISEKIDSARRYRIESAG